jgi:hypothetical protein
MKKHNEGIGIAGREGSGIAISRQEGTGLFDGIGGALGREGIGGA